MSLIHKPTTWEPYPTPPTQMVCES